MSPDRPIALALCIALLATVGLGCPPRTVIRDGREVPVTEASKDDFAVAQDLEKQGKSTEAIAKYEKFITEFKDSELIDQALAAIGRLAASLEQHDKAVDALQRLVAEYPSSPHYLASAVQLGLSLAKLGRKAEALPTLQSVFDRLPDPKRKREVAGLLADSYHMAGDAVEAIRWYSVVYGLSTDEDQRGELHHRVSQLIERSLSFVGVREAVEILKQSGVNGFPRDLLEFKLAKIFYHVYEFELARARLESFVATWPEHALTKEAGHLLKKIIDRDRVAPNTIGVLLPLSGPFRAYGQKALAGIQLGAGIFEDNKPGEEYPVLVIRDTAGDADLAARHMEDMVLNEHVVAVIGPIFSLEAHRAAIKAEELSVPIITLSLREDITTVGPWVFRNFLTLAAQARLLVSYAMDKLGVRTFALLYPNDKYGVGFVNAFWDEVKKRKGEIRAAERYEPDAKNFAEPIKKMVGRYWLEARWDFINARSKIRNEHKNNPLARKRAMEKLVKQLSPKVDFGALFIPEYHEKVAMIAPQVAFEDIVLKTDSHWKLERMKKSLGRDRLDMIYLLGGNGWNNPQLVEWAERYIQGAIFCDGFFADSNRPATREFVGRFKTQFDRPPDWVEAHAYDTASMVRQVIKKQKPRTRQAFHQALRAIKDFEGATGKTTFDAQGEAIKDLFLLTIKKEEIVEIELGPEGGEQAGGAPGSSS